ncbi:lipid IV(A) 3-deoxy-D-manno-octulosonic acid transferase [Amphritea sp. 1_MG-2023]|uniref:lipid IV(A) 3-deoxy-D-manno-octulosonic acid transferase n=1 Tax=Amphritea sp. 1_MG-2023 TaxID=3062670 RepID=UPI0026E23C82|nr:lipid IV(A) 3-deoxy-D-manno-octulosonic acid transferase [Amphritea sp. 1_MG-2023]MDO6564778.1 lipid IV(A) 3-deoxy-D-manno-octulosonic acid transferase [Amphritea sp. 1_MG-2023]
MARFLYSLLFYCLTPLILLKLWRRGRQSPEYRQRWRERFGFVPRLAGERPIWIHAVSFGETMAIIPLVEKLLTEQPSIPVFITSMTPTGSARVQHHFGDRVGHAYCPYDLPDALSRFHRRIQPRSCVIVETELWPNLIHSCAKRGVPILVTNARLSARSARGYQRFQWLIKPMLQEITTIAVQNQTDAERFAALGLSVDKLQVTGSIKFDIAAPQNSVSEAAHLRAAWGAERPVIIAASTHDDEEAQLLEVFANLQSRYHNLLLILVPRHPERFTTIYDQSLCAGFETCRRSQASAPTPECEVYLGDTMGDLMTLYSTADMAFVGGSLIERGGHNPLEPAVLAKPVLMGPYVYNFQHIVETMTQELALQVVSDAAELQSAMAELLAHPAQAQAMGMRGSNYIAANRGALEQQLALLKQQAGIDSPA